MAAPFVRPLVGGMLLASLVLLTIAPSAPEPLRSQTPAEQEASLARLRERLAQAKSVVVTHEVYRRDPASFETARPCRVQSTADRFSGTFDGEWARRFLECLQPDSFAFRHGVPKCRPGFSRSDRVAIEFGPGPAVVKASVTLESGELTLFGEGEPPYAVALGRRTADLRALLQQAAPSDTSLARALVCTQPFDEPGLSRRAPRVGEYVYVEVLPEAIRKVPPVYPDAAREANVDGQVIVQALIGKNGRVSETMVAHSIPPLDAAAVAAVEQWEFKPARTNGEPVAVWVAIPVKFRLR